MSPRVLPVRWLTCTCALGVADRRAGADPRRDYPRLPEITQDYPRLLTDERVRIIVERPPASDKLSTSGYFFFCLQLTGEAHRRDLETSRPRDLETSRPRDNSQVRLIVEHIAGLLRGGQRQQAAELSTAGGCGCEQRLFTAAAVSRPPSWSSRWRRLPEITRDYPRLPELVEQVAEHGLLVSGNLG